jgi:ABC-2 type transport system ATP-binding protein
VTGTSSFAIEFTGEDQDQADLLAAMMASGVRVIDFRERKFDLEDVFLQVTTGAVN